jgi:hypothetical protein
MRNIACDGLLEKRVVLKKVKVTSFSNIIRETMIRVIEVQKDAVNKVLDHS